MNVAQQLRAAASERILVKDGAYGTQVQARRLARPIMPEASACRATRRAITTS
jgi:methionine synthase I (cobalamin-dependent)